MDYDTFVNNLLEERLIKKQRVGFIQIEKTLIRAKKDLNTAKIIIETDEAMAYTAAYDAMLRAGRAFIFMKGFRPSERYQHKTVVDFMAFSFGARYKSLMELFDMMRKKRNKFLYEAIDISQFEAKIP